MGSRRVPRRRGRRGGRTPPAGQATSCGDPGPARGGVASGRAACAVHFLFSARGLPPPRARRACVPAAPPLAAGSLCPGRGAADGRSGRALGLAGPREPSRRRDSGAQPSGSPIAWAFAFAPPPPASPLWPGGGTGRAPDSGLVHSAAEDYIYMQTVSLSPDGALGRRHGGSFPRLLSFRAPALRITSGNPCEELRGWRMLLRFAKGRKLCHPAGDLCHA